MTTRTFADYNEALNQYIIPTITHYIVPAMGEDVDFELDHIFQMVMAYDELDEVYYIESPELFWVAAQNAAL